MPNDYPTPHWTDRAAAPVFDTVIPASGPAGNIYAIVGTACRHLREIGVPPDRAERLRAEVGCAQSYDAAVALVERWFRVER